MNICDIRKALSEAYVWRERKNFVKEFDTLAKLLPLLNPLTPEIKNLAAHALNLFATTCRYLALPEESI